MRTGIAPSESTGGAAAARVGRARLRFIACARPSRLPRSATGPPTGSSASTVARPARAPSARFSTAASPTGRTSHAPGRWDLYRCGECGCAFLDPRPTRQTVTLAYGNYYEDAADSARRRAAAAGEHGWRSLRRAIRNGYLNARFGYGLAPASRLGRLVVPLLPRQREKADEHVRHLSLRPGRPRLLDVGCGEGEFVAEMASLGWDAEGIDPTADAVDAARGRGVRVTTGRPDGRGARRGSVRRDHLPTGLRAHP